MASNIFQDIKSSLHQLCLEDTRPWLVGFSGGKSLPPSLRRDSTMLAARDPGHGRGVAPIINK
jgi:hypothetical protein